MTSSYEIGGQILDLNIVSDMTIDMYFSSTSPSHSA